jgi:hypothetical protein
LWKTLVSSEPTEHFRPGDVPLLRSYVEATMLADLAAAEISAAGPVVQGRVSAWTLVLEKAHRSQAALAAKLRLCPSSRADPKTVARAHHRPSAYELQILDDQDR